MTYEELKAAYEAAVQKCSELEKENDELKKSNEDQALHIEHLEEQILKRNKMLFEQKSEKSKFICDGQMNLDGNVFNEAEELSNLSAAEPTEDSITKKSKKTGKHRGRNAQGRVTDHRINLTLYRLDEVMEGKLDMLIEPIIQEHQADQLAALSEQD